jgi:transposase-like protein
MLEGLRKPTELVMIVVTLLSYGCPIQAIVQAFGLDERTVASWRDRAGKHCQQVHQALVAHGQLDAQQVQVDEIRVKGRGMIAWMGLALMVPTRLWLAGVVSVQRDRRLADQLMQQVRACCRRVQALLVAPAGWAAYPGSIQRALREKVKRIAGRGRACLQVWSELCLATIIKRTQKRRVVEVTRKMMLGTVQQATKLLQASLGGSVLKTACSERFNGTMRERLAALTRNV